MYRQDTHTQQQDNHAASLPQQASEPPGGIMFQTYLGMHHLNPLDVALTSGVRYTTVWNIAHNIPIRPAHAALVRAGLQRLTGVAYTVPIALLPLPDKQSTIRKER